VTEKSFLVGLIGAGIQGSRTPALHEHEAAAQGLRLIDKLIDLERLPTPSPSCPPSPSLTDTGAAISDASAALPELLRAAELMGFAGLNITYPCKQTVIPLLDELSDDARALGAVNTVVLRDGRRIGHNTDMWGFAENFRRGLPDVPRARVVQLGAGGAGSAVAYAALALGVQQLSIFDIDPDRASKVADMLCARFGAGRAVAPTDLATATRLADGIINTTPVGMAKHPGLPLPAELLRPELWVAEIVYFPLETELLRSARALGCHTLHGGGMAVFQAVEAFRLFTGVEPDSECMLAHFAVMAAT